MDEELITSEHLRLDVTNYAKRAEATGTSWGVQAVRGRPRYQLASVSTVASETIRTCVRLGPDEFRRRYSEIRALVRVDDVPFGILVQGTLLAIFRRHPTYRPVAAEGYREQYLARKNESPIDLVSLVRSLEARVATLETAAKLPLVDPIKPRLDRCFDETAKPK